MSQAYMDAVEIREYQGRFELAKRHVLEPESGEVRVRVIASGLCSTDLHLLEGRWDLGVLPRIPGHEIAGVVDQVGAGSTPSLKEKRVTVCLDVTCGGCMHCRTGQAHRCPYKERIGFERDGGHAEYVVVPERNLVELPDSVGFEDASILPDAVACMYHSLIGQGHLGISDTVVIHGAGGLGIHGVQIAKYAGADVAATSRNPRRLASVAEYGALPINTRKQDPVVTVQQAFGKEGADLVADCIGTRESILQSLAMIRPGGKVLVIAYISEEFGVNSIDLMAKEKELIGCRGSTLHDLEQVVRLVGHEAVRPVIGARFGLSEINEAADLLRRGEVPGRIVLTR